jgi:hypothetical protein
MPRHDQAEHWEDRQRTRPLFPHSKVGRISKKLIDRAKPEIYSEMGRRSAPARMQCLTAEHRSKIARKAAKARWRKKSKSTVLPSPSGTNRSDCGGRIACYNPRMKTSLAICVAGALIAVAILTTCHWQLLGPRLSSGESVIRLNRWTGTIDICSIDPKSEASAGVDKAGARLTCSPD